MSITHSFVSAKSDPTDLTLVKPSNWNAEHVITGLPLVSSDYNFAAQSPGGSLIIGANSITLSPVPSGVNGTDVGHYLYISNGVGTAEAVLITGGTAVAGATSGTLIFTCAGTHSGAWDIRSATGGIAEAYQVICTDKASKGAIQIDETVIMYQGVYAKTSSERIAFIGLGREAFLLIQRATSFASGDLFHNSVSACWYFKDLGMTNSLVTPGAMTGCGIYVGPGQVQVNSLTILNGQYGIRLYGANTSTIDNYAYLNNDYTFQGIAGISLENLCVNIWLNNCISGSPLSSNANQLVAGLRLLSVDGLWATQCVFSGTTGIQISATGNYIANVFFLGGGVDGCLNFCIAISSGAQLIVNLQFIGTHVASQSDGATYGLGPAVYVQSSASLYLLSLLFSGGEITSSAAEGVSIEATGCKELAFVGVEFKDNNVANTAGKAAISCNTGVTGLRVEDCYIGNAGGNGHQKYAIKTLGTCGGMLVGNDFVTNDTAPLNINGVFTGVIKNNLGIDNLIGSVADAATIVWPVNPNFIITGSGTGVTAVTMTNVPIGASGTFRTTGGAITFTAGGGIGNTLTTVQNVPVIWSWDGTSLWLK